LKSLFGNVVRGKDGLLYGKPRKTYIRNHPYPQNTMRIKPLQREKASIVMLRKLGYTINLISEKLGRSRSFIHRTLRFNLMLKNLPLIDMRKMPNKIRQRAKWIRWEKLTKLWPLWEAWILGKGEKPP